MPLCSAQIPRMSPCVRTVTHHSIRLRCAFILTGSLLFAPGISSSVAGGNNQVQAGPMQTPSGASSLQVQCLPDGAAFLRARLKGAIDTELSWSGHDLSCAGSVRPNSEGIRLRFTSPSRDGKPNLVLLFGITGLQEGEAGKALPVNLTIMREGTGEFYGTQGDNKCTIDDLRQEPINGIPWRERAYRVIARGFCTQPARALNGAGSVLITRFDFAGRADFVSEDTDAPVAAPPSQSTARVHP